MDFPFLPVAIKQLFSKPSCDMYPFKESIAAPGYRGRIKYNPEKCLGCGMCEKVCAGGAITRTLEEVEEGTKITLSFNLGSCTFCSHCADFCSSKAIELTQDYHMVATKEEDLVVTGSRIKPKKKAGSSKPKQNPETCVYCTLCAKKCPEEAIEVDRSEKTWKLDESKCIECGTCVGACPKKSITMGEEAEESSKPKQNPETCVYCTLCAKKCPQEAIEVDRAEKTWKLDESKCIECGTCVGACPKKSITM